MADTQNTDQNEAPELKLVTEETVADEQVQQPQAVAPPVGQFSLICNGDTWQTQTNMGRFILIGVLRDVINRLETQPVVQPAVPVAQPAPADQTAQPAEEATPDPQEQEDG